MRWSKSCENVHPPALTGTAPINHKQASLVLRLANLNFRMLRRRALPSCFQYRGDDLRLNLDGSDLRYICVPEVMEISISFENSQQVEDERLMVARLLIPKLNYAQLSL